MIAPLLPALHLVLVSAPSGDLETRVATILDDACTACHGSGGDPSTPDGLDLSGSPSSLLNKRSAVTGEALVKPGDPAGSYLVLKLEGGKGMQGERMPAGEGPLAPDQIATIRDWIAQVSPTAAAPEPTAPDTTSTATGTEGGSTDEQPSGIKPFHGTYQSVLPTTTTLGRRTLEFRILHRFGQIGAERGAFGLDVGAVMSLGLQYGIFDGWDVLVRRTNSHKGYEFGTKYVFLRQEAGQPLSLGLFATAEGFRDFPGAVENRWSGNFVLMISRLWFSRWSTMLTVGYHLRTNHAPGARVDYGDGMGPVPVKDRRDTLTLGLASTVWLGKRRRWGVDLEWLLPIPDGRKPNLFYYHGGDADPAGTRIGAWTLGGSYRIGQHFFQVMFTNTRELHSSLAASGGQTANPFPIGGRPNFFLGFNLTRKFVFKPPSKRPRRVRAKEASP